MILGRERSLSSLASSVFCVLLAAGIGFSLVACVAEFNLAESLEDGDRGTDDAESKSGTIGASGEDVEVEDSAHGEDSALDSGEQKKEDEAVSAGTGDRVSEAEAGEGDVGEGEEPVDTDTTDCVPEAGSTGNVCAPEQSCCELPGASNGYSCSSDGGGCQCSWMDGGSIHLVRCYKVGTEDAYCTCHL